jgi:N-acetylneuraminate lyase
MDLSGLYVATLTPFNHDETLNTNDLTKLIEFNCQSELDGLYVGGSTGEAFLCSIEERIQLLEITADKAVKEKKLIAHIGDISTRNSEILAKTVANLRYDAVSAVTPFYYPIGFEQLKNHYRDIIQKCGKPMVVYNFPAFAGVNLNGDQISQLLNIDGVIALKQTSANLYQMEQITRQNPDKTVYNGFDEILLSGLVAGAKGGIGSTYNIQAQRIVELFKAINTNQVTKATVLQGEVNVVIDTLIEEGVIPSLKYILKAKGVIENDTCRRPMNKLTSEGKNKLDRLIETTLF